MRNFIFTRLVYWSLAPALLLGCGENKGTDVDIAPKEDNQVLFELLEPGKTNVSFVNTLNEGLNLNVLLYEYLYNGGGVATADFNNDGLSDIYFTSNMGDNALYLNKGDLIFEDITVKSGAGGRKGPWKTGVTAADVNADGLIDIYVCYSGTLPPGKRKNQLFINQGVNDEGHPTFVDKASDFGLASEAYSNQAHFLDYDHDGDLDMLLLNHNPKSLPVLNEATTKRMLKVDDPLSGLRLYRQDKGYFNDVTLEAGLVGSGLSYGLGLCVSDLNNDGWEDFYLSNDYTIPDYLYINNKDGSFTDELQNSIGHTSHFSMGNTVADINNDGLQDIYTLDMLPEDNRRQKLLMWPDNYEKFDLNVRSGFHYQYMRNMLQLNNGNDTFSEIGQLLGISNTDWSWAPLFADFTNNGHKDLFVTNGYFRDYTNLDFINYMDDFVGSKGRLKREDVLQLIEKMPSTGLSNYFFEHTGSLRFQNKTAAFGLEKIANSNGASYADLDNDGDLEIIVNNINSPAFIYKNLSVENSKTKYLQVALKGKNGNTQGLGAKVTLYHNGSLQILEQMPTKGYLSTVSEILHFGLNDATGVDSLKVRWNTGEEQTLKNIKANKRVELYQDSAFMVKVKRRDELTNFRLKPIDFKTKTNDWPGNDFKRQPLMIRQLSHSTGGVVAADFNKDGKKDIVQCSNLGTASQVYLQDEKGRFTASSSLKHTENSVQTAALVLDVNNDGNLDLYMGNGGYHNFSTDDGNLFDILYLGDGTGNLRPSNSLPTLAGTTTALANADINSDGFEDVFVGQGYVPGRYPEVYESYFLINQGGNKFQKQEIKALRELGPISDAVFVDLDNDGRKELILTGQWMPITILKNESSLWVDQTKKYFDEPIYGWWQSLLVQDLNNDGLLDLVAGNMGGNTQMKASQAMPLELFYADFDNNGAIDPILCYRIKDKNYPAVTRDELVGQLPYLKAKYNSYSKYADATLVDVFGEEKLKEARRKYITELETCLFINDSGRFKKYELPIQGQFSPINEILGTDVNDDGNPDLLLFGNEMDFKLRFGRTDANYGMLLLGKSDNTFEYVPQHRSGLNTFGKVDRAVLLNRSDLLLSTRNGITIYERNKELE